MAGLILGIESSCDETAAAVVRNGSEVLANVVASQVTLHAAYGGVVPELASREHLRNLVPVVREAMRHAAVAFDDLDAIAVTEGPGLAGALLVGILYAKALAYALGKPIIAVNHLEGHIHAVLMQSHRHGIPAPDAPLVALVVSGGHTHLYLFRLNETGAWRYRNVGRTVDDAAGEAFDKVAKLLGLGYPGGPWIDALALHGNPSAVPFHFAQIKSQPTDDHRFDFSFSGIKTGVLRYTQQRNMAASIATRRSALEAAPELKDSEAASLCDPQTLDLIASFQSAVVGNLMRQSFAAVEQFGARGLLVSGGVAANRELRTRFTAEAARRGLPVAFPSIALSTDNAAMIAAAAWPKFLARDFAPDTLTAQPQLRLGAVSTEPGPTNSLENMEVVRLAKLYLADLDAAVVRYIAKHTQRNGTLYISSDAAREQLPGYGTPAERLSNNFSLGPPSSRLADAVWEKAIAQGPSREKPAIEFLTGSPGTGKTRSVLGADLSESPFRIITESMMDDFDRSVARIQQAIDASYTPTIRLVFADDPRTTLRRAVKRAMQYGRPVRIAHMARLYVHIPATVQRIAAYFGTQLGMVVLDNSTDGRPHRRSTLDQASSITGAYTVTTAEEAMLDELDRLCDLGKSTPDIDRLFRGSLGRNDSPADR